MKNNDEEAHAPTSYDPGDIVEGGLAALELEIMQKRVKERKDGMKKYAESKLIPESEGFS